MQQGGINSNVVPMASKGPVDLAWEAYQDLVIEGLMKPALFHDVLHKRRMKEAHARFMQAFMVIP